MALLTKGSYKTTRELTCGLHTVTLVGFGETEATTRVYDNGEVREIKATLWFKLRNTNGAEDRHTFYYETEPALNPETGKMEPVITERDSDFLNRIIRGMVQQIENDSELDELEDLVAILEHIKNTQAQFKVVVSEAPSQDGSRIWKNFSYSKDMIDLITSVK